MLIDNLIDYFSTGCTLRKNVNCKDYKYASKKCWQVKNAQLSIRSKNVSKQ